MDSYSKTSLDPRNTMTDATCPMIFTNDLPEDLFADSSMAIDEQVMEGVQNLSVESESTLCPLIPRATLNEIYAPFLSHPVPMNADDDLMARLCSDIDICQMGDDTFNDLFQLDEPIPLNDISMQVLKSMEGLTQETNDTNATTLLTSNSLGEVNFSPRPGVVVPETFISAAGEGSSKGPSQELGGIIGSNAWYPPQPVGASSFCNSIFPNTTGISLTQFQSPSFPLHPYGCASTGASASFDYGATASARAGATASFGVGATASTSAGATASFGVDATASASAGATASFGVDATAIASGGGASVGSGALLAASAGGIACTNVNANVATSTTVRLATINPQNPPQVSAALGNSVFSNTMGNPFTQFQSCPSSSIPVLPYGSSSSSGHQQFPRQLSYQMTGVSAQGIPTMIPQYSRGNIWLRPPPFTDFPKFVPAWEGSLVGKVHSFGQFLSQARAVRNPTSSVTFTAEWRPMLEIVIFIPISAINYTMKVYGGPVDYVFFHITHFNNLDLHDHLMSKNLCAKIELPSHTIILSTTDSKYHFLGAIFPGDTVFVEPV